MISLEQAKKWIAECNLTGKIDPDQLVANLERSKRNPFLEDAAELVAVFGFEDRELPCHDHIEKRDAVRYIAKILHEPGAKDRVDEVLEHIGRVGHQHAEAFKVTFLMAAGQCAERLAAENAKG